MVKELQKYMSVDIFGSCGPLKCNRVTNQSENDPCRQMLDNYKFYLSFENSLWEDYVTEKLFNVMTRFIIPIVYGGANYSHFVPPHSVIDANGFGSVKKLAEYLIYLDTHPEDYVKYFWWHNHYKVVPDAPMIKFCSLCIKLHEPNVTETHKVYHDIDGWWNKKPKKMTKPLIVF